jgi:hypothetical protein
VLPHFDEDSTAKMTSFFVPSRLRDRWLWDRVCCLLFLFVPMPMGVLLVACGGAKGLFFLSGAGVPFAAVYAWVGMRVRGLKRCVPIDSVEVVEVLVAQNNYRSPGVAALCADRIEFFRVLGAPITIKLSDMDCAKEITWFNHARQIWWKKAFEIKAGDAASMQIAIPEPVALRWRKFLGLTQSLA